MLTTLRGTLPSPLGGVYGSIVCVIPKCLGLILDIPLAAAPAATKVSGVDIRSSICVTSLILPSAAPTGFSTGATPSPVLSFIFCVN